MYPVTCLMVLIGIKATKEGNQRESWWRTHLNSKNLLKNKTGNCRAFQGITCLRILTARQVALHVMVTRTNANHAAHSQRSSSIWPIQRPSAWFAAGMRAICAVFAQPICWSQCLLKLDIPIEWRRTSRLCSRRELIRWLMLNNWLTRSKKWRNLALKIQDVMRRR